MAAVASWIVQEVFEDGEAQWLSLRAAARRVDRDLRTIKRWHAEGMPVVQFEGKGYVQRDELLAWWRKNMLAHPFLQRHLARVRRERDEAEARAA